MNAYEIIIFYSAEDGGYIAEIPELRALLGVLRDLGAGA